MQTEATFTFADIAIGQAADFSVMITDELVAAFAAVSGDYNSLHMDETYAKTTPFAGRVVHGQLGVSFFSQLIGMHLPGRFALYLNQTSAFRAPMRIGMTVKIKGTVVQKTDATKTLMLATEIIDTETGTLLTDGKALVNMLQ